MGGNNEHEHICESLDLFAEEVPPAFHERDDAQVRRKEKELAPYIEEAFDRTERMEPLGEDDPPAVGP